MIDKRAVVDRGAILEEDVKVGPYAIIEVGVRLGKGVVISAFCHLKGNTYIGDNTFIGTGAVIGEVPQILGVTEAIGETYIGKNNTIREYVTINCASSPNRATAIGDNNFLMAFSHIAHDCKLANNIVICNGVLIAGHVEIGDKVFISGNTAIQQFVRIGRLVMISGLSRVNQNIPPFMMVVGDSKVWGINIVGLRRAAFTREDVSCIKKAYNLIYRKKLSLKNALTKLEDIESSKVKEMSIFIISSKKGICGSKRNSFWEKIFLEYPYLIRIKIPTYESLLKRQRSYRNLT